MTEEERRAERERADAAYRAAHSCPFRPDLEAAGAILRALARGRGRKAGVREEIETLLADGAAGRPGTERKDGAA